MWIRLTHLIATALGLGLLAFGPVAGSNAGATAKASGRDGIVRIASGYPLEETITRIKDDIKQKGIMLFDDIDQAKLAAGAGIVLHPSRLIVFGNPPLGTLFITADAEAGLDWPVRLLVYENDNGKVWMAYTDFGWTARRHKIRNRTKEFAMASEVITSITASAMAK
jgi:uncharacterized protein (DUF302 family)